MAQIRKAHRDEGTAEALQAEVEDRLASDVLVDRRVCLLAEQDLAGSRDIAQPRREDDDLADRAVLVAALEADPAERRVARRDPDPQAELVAPLPPTFCKRREALAQRQCGSDGGELVVLDRRGVVEKRHQPVACEVLNRPLVGRDELAGHGVVLAQYAEHLLRLRRLGERGEAAKIAVISRLWPARSCFPSSLESRFAACGAKRASSVRCRSTV